MVDNFSRSALWAICSDLAHWDQVLYAAWVRRESSTESETWGSVTSDAPASSSPFVSLIVVDEGHDDALRTTLESLRAQRSQDFEVLVSLRQERREVVRAWNLFDAVSGSSPCCTLVVGDWQNLNLGQRGALEAARGEFIGFMSAGDRLAPHAVAAMRSAWVGRPEAVVLYSDEDWIDPAGVRTWPRFKTGWDPDAQLGFDLLGCLCLMRRQAVLAAGGPDPDEDPASHFGLHCRVTTALASAQVLHVAAVLYHRAVPRDVVYADACAQARRLAEQARQIAARTVAAREGRPARVMPSELAPWVNRICRALPEPVPLVSVIVPTRDMASLLENCVRGVLDETDYPALELLVLDNGSEEPQTAELLGRLAQDSRVRVLPMPGPFNYAKLNNDGVTAARGDVIVLLNNDIQMLHAGWLREMVALAVRPDVGCVGAKLLYPDRRVQHAGVILAPGPLAMHAFRLENAIELGHDAQLAGVREYLAVTAACLAIRRRVFDEAGGFDAHHFQVAFNDVDLCLRVADLGYRNLCTPFATLLHLESASRGDDLTGEKRLRWAREHARLMRRWIDRFDRDPARNPNLSYTSERGIELASGLAPVLLTAR